MSACAQAAPRGRAPLLFPRRGLGFRGVRHAAPPMVPQPGAAPKAAAPAGGADGETRGRAATPPELVSGATVASASALHARELQCMVEGRLARTVLEQHADLSRSIALCLEVLGIGTSSPGHQAAAAGALVELVTHTQLRPAVDPPAVLRRLGRIVQLTDSPTALAAASDALFAIADDDPSWRQDEEGPPVMEPLRAALASCIRAIGRVAEGLRRAPDPRVMTADQVLLVTAAAAALRPRALHLLSPAQMLEAVGALAVCLTADRGDAVVGDAVAGLRSTLLAALAAVLQRLPAGADSCRAARAVVDAGAVPALVAAISTAPTVAASVDGGLTPAAGSQRTTDDGGSPEIGASPPAPEDRQPWRHLRPWADTTIASSGGDASSASDGSSGGGASRGPSADGRRLPRGSTCDAFAALEVVMVTSMTSAPGVARRAAVQALTGGAAEAVTLLLLQPPPPPSSPLPKRSFGGPPSTAPPVPTAPEPWRLLRILLVLARFRRSVVTTAIPRSDGDRVLTATAAAARALLSTPHSLTDSTAESLLLLFAELLSPTAAAVTVAGADCSVEVPALVSAEQLRKAAPGLVAAALGILMGGRPGHDWAALLTCARERNLQSGSGTIRFPVQLEAAAAALLDELLVWAAAVREGEDGGWRSWLPVAALAGALVQRWLDRPGVFEALGGAGLRCLTLSLQLAPPAELWAGERISDIPRLARRVRAMLDRHKSMSAWQLALLAALSAAAGAKGISKVSSNGSLTPAAATAESKLCDDPEAACKVSHSSGSGPEAQAQTDSHVLDQVKAPHPEPCPQAAALELMAHLVSLVAVVKLAKLAPVERLGVVAGALNAAVACVAPQRAVRQGAAAALLLPSLCKMQLLLGTAPAPTSAVAKASPAVWAPPLETCTAPSRQALLRAMSQVHARLDLLLAEAMEAPAAAGWGGDSDGDGSGGNTDGGQDQCGAASGGGGGSSGGAGDSDPDPNGSFAGADLGELMPTMSAALRVGASAAAVIAECTG